MGKRERRRNRLPEGCCCLQEFIKAYDIKNTDDLKGARRTRGRVPRSLARHYEQLLNQFQSSG